MRILAVDTSCDAASVCLYDGATQASLAARGEAMSRGHAQALAPMVSDVLAEAGFAATSIDRIAVTVGPGSFTGIRVGLALCRAMGLALDVPVVGISTLVALAGPLFLASRSGVIVSAIDARHGWLYFQVFEPQGRPLTQPRIDLAEAAARAAERGPVRVTGAGARLFVAAAQSTGLQIDESACAAFPDAVALARLGAAADPLLCPPRPLYIKAPDAEVSTIGAIARTEG